MHGGPAHCLYFQTVVVCPGAVVAKESAHVPLDPYQDVQTQSVRS